MYEYNIVQIIGMIFCFMNGIRYLIYIHKHMYTYIFFKIIKTTCKKKVDTRSQRFMMHAHD